MARFAGITYDLLGPQTQPRMRAHNILCFHTMAGSFAGTDRMFHEHGFAGTESHVGVRADGFGKGWQEPDHTADANLYGNPEVLSIETEDYGGVFGKWNLADPAQIPAWTPEQCARLIDLGVQACLPGTHPRSIHRDCPKNWACYRHGIPAVLIPDTRPGARGIGYHAQGVPGVGLVAGGVQWSKARGKQCPGARRIAQLKTVIIPGIQAALAGHHLQEDPLSGYSPDQLEQYAGVGVHQQQLGRAVLEDGKTPLTFGIAAERTYKSVATLTAQVTALTAAVKALATAQGANADQIEATVDAAVKDALQGLSITLSTGA